MKHHAFVLLIAAFLTVTAAAQGPGTSTGPDVIVGGITGPSNYLNNSTHDAFTIGTTSCNIGDTPLLWQANNSNHPVIAQNLFRYQGGRFEHVGQSWLKHGFLALAGTVCGGPCLGPGGSHLDPGCSDPYGSSLNGDQTGLGPKFEVNAATGVFPYPYTEGNQGITGDQRYKRIRVALSDLDPGTHPGAIWIAEAQYTANDDAAAGNNSNNASWRQAQMSSAGSGYSMSFPLTNPTHRQQTAIEAWQTLDPGVEIAPIDVIHDGRFWVGFKSTPLPNGKFAWEFAVQNMTSHRSGQAFHIDVPAGATVTNIGFHDVSYHSGEPFSGTDWSSSVAGNTVTWSTQTFAQNVNANALRWGTLYNFRFETDVPPPPAVTATIDLFRPGQAGDPNSISTNFQPPPSIALLGGGLQGTNSGTTFNQPLAVNLSSAGSPVAGQTIFYSVVSGPVALSASSAVTGANGNASVSALALAGTGGAAVVRAETGPGNFVDFQLFVRHFEMTWVGPLGLLIATWQSEAALTPVLVTLDSPGQPVIPTPWGDICTTILNPGPSFLATSGDPAGPNFDPALITDSVGNLSRSWPGLLALTGTGLSLAFQPLLAFIDANGQIDIAIGNCRVVVF